MSTRESIEAFIKSNAIKAVITTFTTGILGGIALAIVFYFNVNSSLANQSKFNNDTETELKTIKKDLELNTSQIQELKVKFEYWERSQKRFMNRQDKFQEEILEELRKK